MQNNEGRQDFRITLDNSQLRADAIESRRLLEGIGSTAKQEGNEIDAAMKKIGTSIAGVFAVSKLKDFAKQVATVRGEFQQLEIAFKTMLGSKSEAEKLMSQLIQTAVITPFNMSDVANSAKQLLAYGVEADKVNETLIRLGDIAAGLSIPINDLAYLYGTTMVQGRMYTQDLNQFLGRGIPLTEELAKQFGVSKNKVKELVEEGKVGFPEVEKAIISLTSEGGKFGGLMEAQSASITGQISNIEDSIEQMFNEIGKSSEGVIGEALNGVSNVIDHWREIGKVILIAAAAFGTYKAALITVNVIQKISNTLTAEAALQQKLAAMSGIALSQAEAMAAARTTLLTVAWNGLKAAIMSNPIGLILGVLAGAATAIGLFSSDTSEAAEMSEKFGESAAKEMSRLNTLTTTLKGLTSGTSTHKKVLEELNGILEEYGIAQIKEGDNIDIVNAKREQAIELIKREAIERQRANNLDQGEQTYQEGIKKAQGELNKQLHNAETGGSYLGFMWTSANDEIRKNADAISNIIGQTVQENISLIANKTGEEYDKGLQQIYDKINNQMRAIGISEKTIAQTWTDDGFFMKTFVIQSYIDAVQDLSENHDRYTEATNKVADAERKAAEDTMTFSERVEATKRSLRGASDDVHTLYKNIKNLMSKYNENTIGFTIKFNAEVPKWMNNMKLSELQRLAAEFSAMGDQLVKGNKTGALVSGKWMTTQQILQRGADYGQAAENKQDAADKKQRELEATEKERKKKTEQAKKKAEEERKRIADQTAERNKSIAEYGRSVAEQEKQTAIDIAQSSIDAMEDGFDKQLATIEYGYDRLKEENARRETEMLEALAKNKLNEWLNEHPKATKQQQTDYYNSLLDKDSKTRLTRSDLTQGQQDQLAAYDTINDQIYLKQKHDLYQSLLDEYQDYETRRAAIREKFEKQRKALENIETTDDNTKASLISGWDTMSAEQQATAWDEYVAKVKASITELGRQEKEEIKSVNDEEVAALQKSSTLLVDLFSDASDKSDKEIRTLIEDTQALLDYLKKTDSKDITPKFGFTAEQLKTMKESPEQLKSITTELEELKKTANKSNPFKTLAEDIKNLFTKPKEGDKKESTEAKLKKLGASASECADEVGSIAGKLSEMFEAAGNDSMAQAMSDVQDVMSSVSNIGKGFAEGGLIGGISAAAGEAIGWVTKAFAANARHAAALKEILKETTAQQRAYNLALLDENLAMEQAVTIFGTLDYDKATNAVDVMHQAWADLRKEIEGTAEQQAKFELKSSKNAWVDAIYKKNYSALKDTYSGLADIQIKTGHKKTGLFGWGKGKDTYSSILDVYPELIDGQGKFNVELAKSIIETRTFSDEGKEALQYMIDLAEEAEEAYQSVKDYLTDIFGDLGDTMSDALVDAFTNGTDAAEAFGDSVTEMLENLGKQMIFSTLFSQIIQKANDEMLETMTNTSMTEEEKFNKYIAILDTMTSGILGQQDNYNALMKKYQEMAAEKGINLWQEDSSRSASETGIASASQDSVEELNGRMTAVQGHTFSISENTKLLVSNTQAILLSVMGIENNTNELPSRLATMETSLKDIKNTVDDIVLKGIKIQ